MTTPFPHESMASTHNESSTWSHAAITTHNRHITPFIWIWVSLFFGIFYVLIALDGTAVVAHYLIAKHQQEYRPAQFVVTNFGDSHHEVYDWWLQGSVQQGDTLYPREILSGESAYMATGLHNIEAFRRLKPGTVLPVLFNPAADNTIYQGEPVRVIHTNTALHAYHWKHDKVWLIPLLLWFLFCLAKLQQGLSRARAKKPRRRPLTDQQKARLEAKFGATWKTTLVYRHHSLPQLLWHLGLGLTGLVGLCWLMFGLAPAG